jgi:hypothetical protein
MSMLSDEEFDLPFLPETNDALRRKLTVKQQSMEAYAGRSPQEAQVLWEATQRHSRGEPFNLRADGASVIPQSRAVQQQASGYVPRPYETNPAHTANMASLDEQIKAHSAKEAELSGPPDYSELQNYARNRSSTFLPMALSAAMLGRGPRGTEPLAKIAAGQAQQALDPIKVEGGYIDANGTPVIDPGFARTKQAEALRNRILALQKLKQEGVSDEIRAQATHEQKEAARQLQALGLDLRSQGLDVQRQGQGLAADARADRAEERGRKEKFDQSMKLSREYDTRVKSFSEGMSAAQNLIQLAAAPNAATDPQIQTSMVFAFGRMLDPTSVVREGEYKLFEQGRGWLEALMMTPDRIRSGARLSPEQLQRMAATAQQLIGDSQARKQALQDYYAQKGSRWQLDPSDIMPDYGPRLSSPGAPGGGGRTPAEQAEDFKRQAGAR